MYIGTEKYHVSTKSYPIKKKHNLHVVKVNKVRLFAFDEKRFVLDNGIETLAFGHYRVTNQ
jgi:hypothetical protein